MTEKIKNLLQDCFYEKLGVVMKTEGIIQISDDMLNEIDAALKDYADEVDKSIESIVYDFYDQERS